MTYLPVKFFYLPKFVACYEIEINKYAPVLVIYLMIKLIFHENGILVSDVCFYVENFRVSKILSNIITIKN